MASHSQLVRDFIAAFNANDVDRIMTFFQDDAVYHNIPIPAVQGCEAIRRVLEGFLGAASEVDWIVHNLAETEDGTVLTERTDRFKVGGKWIELPVMGSFVVRDGKLAEWRDYFDLQQYRSQLPEEAE